MTLVLFFSSLVSLDLIYDTIRKDLLTINSSRFTVYLIPCRENKKKKRASDSEEIVTSALLGFHQNPQLRWKNIMYAWILSYFFLVFLVS